MNDHHPSTNYSFLFIPFFISSRNFLRSVFSFGEISLPGKKEKERPLQQVRIKDFIWGNQMVYYGHIMREKRLKLPYLDNRL
jgi:hypothetical protein